MESVVVNFEGVPVTVHPQTNLSYARFQSIIAKMFVFSQDLANAMDCDIDEILVSLSEFAQMSSQCSKHPKFALSTDSIETLHDKSKAWLLESPDEYENLRNAAERVKTALIDPATSPLGVSELADPKS